MLDHCAHYLNNPTQFVSQIKVKIIEYAITRTLSKGLHQFTCTNDAKRSLVSSIQILIQSDLYTRASWRPRLPFVRRSIRYLSTLRTSWEHPVPHAVGCQHDRRIGYFRACRGDGIRCEQERVLDRTVVPYLQPYVCVYNL
jgi:hypothetical protein